MTEQQWHDKVIFAYIDEPPFAYPNADGEAMGCDVELVQTILRMIGVAKIETRMVTFPELLEGVARQEWTINTPLFITPERSELVTFSRPVWALPDGFIVRRNDEQIFTSYSAIAEHDTAILGVVQGQVQHQSALNAGIPPERIRIFEAQDAIVAALLENKVDAYAATAMGHRGFVQRAKDERLQVVELEESTAAMGGFSFAKSNTSLIRAFDNALASYLGTDEHRSMMQRYGFTDAEIERVLS